METYWINNHTICNNKYMLISYNLVKSFNHYSFSSDSQSLLEKEMDVGGPHKVDREFINKWIFNIYTFNLEIFQHVIGNLNRINFKVIII